MLDKLEEVAIALQPLLYDEDGWNSLRVDYNHPHVDRLWRQYDDEHRVLLHRIHPCETEQALLHPHPWPSAVRIMGGQKVMSRALYETGVGYGDPSGETPPIAGKFLLDSASSYEMTDPNAWHYVRPINEPIFTLMVIGKPFDTPKQDRFGQLREHGPVDDETRKLILDFWKIFFPPPRRT